jgi:hypothetical protein
MHHHPRTTGRLIGAGVLVAALVTASSCAAGDTAQEPAPPVAAPSTTHGGGHGGQFSAPPAAPLRPGERYENLTMPTAYTPTAPGGGTDEYRCFLVDPKLTAPAFLTGSQFLPQNADIVHHAIFFQVPPDAVDAARRADAKAPGEGWTCFGNAGIGDAAWVAHWAPGANETLLQPDIGYPMPAGSRLVMQVHYNLLSTAGKAGSSDRSGVRLRLSDRAGLTPLRTATLPAPVELACAANESGALCDRPAAVQNVAQRFGEEAAAAVDGLNQGCNAGRAPTAAAEQRCDHPMPAAGTIYATAGHMHLLGRSIKLELNPGRADARTLLDVPSYDFDQQALRPLAAPVTVKKGDVLRVTCTHDVTLRQQIPQLKPLAPRYVVWGEGTSDEMCLALAVMSPTR